ncbi:MAG: 5'/3'-nucleotidase SurE [Candidatus Caldatribacteriota bacterium]|nr:5'/3'-nucleotidase SurE [Candidatus Caldatribacteriota bacterium]
MKILLTNDDGIYSEGIQILKKQLDNIAEVTVIAPDRERSTIGHAMTLRKPLRIRKVKIDGNFWEFSLDGTPADCVIVGLLEIMKDKKPDLIVSGINRGPNLGDDIIYSGTVSAAMEGAMRNIPSLAVSIAGFEDFKFESASLFTKKIVMNLTKNNLPSNLVLNINFPNMDYEEIKGVEITRHGKRVYQDEVKIIHDPQGTTHYWLGGELPEGNIEPDTDFEAIYNNKVSITPLSLDLTNYNIMPKVKDWVKKWNFK